MRKLSALAAAVIAAVSWTGASVASATDNINFHGYFRSGVGISKDGAMTSYHKNHLGRLGNENDTYGEIGFGSTVYKAGDVSFYIDSLLQMSANGSQDGEDTTNDAVFGLRQFNVQAKGLIPGQPDAVVWAGKRFYQKEDVHIIDMDYTGMAGAGAGVEYLKVGPGALSLAWFREDSDNRDYRYENISDYMSEDEIAGRSTTNINYLDARYAGSYWDGGWLEFTATVGIPQDPDTMTITKNNEDEVVEGDFAPVYDNGTSFVGTVVISQDVAGGFNKTVLQYFTKGLANNAAYMGNGRTYSTWTDASDAKGFRIINTGELPVTDNFRFIHSLTYGYASDLDTNIDDVQVLSAVVRASLQTSQYSRILGEFGAFKETTKYKDGTEDGKASGQKYTLALAFAPSKEILSRPELRIYASYLHASDDKKGKDRVPNSLGAPIYDSNFNFGIQGEVWW